ncbi:elongation factor P [Candidatus Kaiserbacteria bacterium]|nr:elongation factor P [Candidatus Kaiserbacteria bacterium]
MLSYNEITQRKYIILDNEPYEVLSSWVFRKQQRKPVNQTKLRSLKTGSTLEHTFHQNDKVREADISTRPVKYLYRNKGEFWFCDPYNPKDRFKLPSEMIGATQKFMKENSEIESLVFNNEIIGISLPVKIDLKVTEAPPSMKGNTAQGGVKQVMLETGATVTTPLFINEGDVIRVNTETGEYVERTEKK